MVIPPAGVTINGTFYANNEMFVNVGPPGAPNPLSHLYIAPDQVTTASASPEFLLLTNNVDDNADGYIDNGWDGINDGNWEIETWRPGQAAGLANQTYAIRRRAAPATGPGLPAVLGRDRPDHRGPHQRAEPAAA